MAWAIGGVAMVVLVLVGAFLVVMLLGYTCRVIEESEKEG